MLLLNEWDNIFNTTSNYVKPIFSGIYKDILNVPVIEKILQNVGVLISLK